MPLSVVLIGVGVAPYSFDSLTGPGELLLLEALVESPGLPDGPGLLGKLLGQLLQGLLPALAGEL